MDDTIQIKRGNKATLNDAGFVDGELKYVKDENSLYIGDGEKNIKLSTYAIEEVDALPTTDINENVIYKIKELVVKKDGDTFTEFMGFISNPPQSKATEDGVIIESEIDIVRYDDPNFETKAITYLKLVAKEDIRGAEVLTLFKGDNRAYTHRSKVNISEDKNLYYYDSGEWVLIPHDVQIPNIKINGVKLDKEQKGCNLNLISTTDIVLKSDFVKPNEKGITIVLDDNTPIFPNTIINDTESFKYSEFKTSSNNIINKHFDILDEKIKGIVTTERVSILPPIGSGVPNRIYLIQKGETNIYDRYQCLSDYSYIYLGTTEIDFSNYYNKAETTEIINNSLTPYQKITDSSLLTTNKKLVNAINELNNKIAALESKINSIGGENVPLTWLTNPTGIKGTTARVGYTVQNGWVTVVCNGAIGEEKRLYFWGEAQGFPTKYLVKNSNQRCTTATAYGTGNVGGLFYVDNQAIKYSCANTTESCYAYITYRMG